MPTPGTEPGGVTHSPQNLSLACPTCGARYVLEKYEPNKKYSCKRCSANLLFGKFALVQELGRGGFGVVYKAWQADLERIVALKFLHTDSEESTERFVREAKIAANLNHPNITAIFEVGQHEGKLYITMQFVDGTTTHKTPLTPREAAGVVRDAALAVDYAHARDVIHRDIKPHNIMVTQERSGTSPSEMNRRTYVMDFGLARTASKGSTLTTEGQIMGTPAYMSPEQAEGRPCDARSDVYSLGATLYTLVTQRAPFEANTPVQVLMKVTQGSPTPPTHHNPELDPNLEAIILKAMELRVEDRYPTAARFAADLSRWLQGEAPDAGKTVRLSSRTTPTLPQAAAPAAPKSRAGLFAAVMALLVAAGGAVAWHQINTSRPDSGSASKSTPPNPVAGTATPILPTPAVPAPVDLLEVRTDPAKATFRIVGVEKDWETPCTITSKDLSYGTHAFQIIYPEYVTIPGEIELKSGQPKMVISRKLEKTPREIALILESDPTKAEVILINPNTGQDENTGQTTPFTLHRDEVRGRVVTLKLKLPGHGIERRTFQLEDKTVKPPKIILQPLAGTLLVRGAPPRATLYLFAVPPDVRNPRSLLGLWSENIEALEQSLSKLDPQDARLAADRLKELARRTEPRIRELAGKAIPSAPAPVQLKPEQNLQVNADGRQKIESAWVTRRYRLLGTSPSTLDFISEEIQPDHEQDRIVSAEMTPVATVSVRMRPATGRFQILLPDGSSAGTLASDGSTLRLPSGPVTFRFTPPPNDPLLREFSVTIPVEDKFELTGNLYFSCAQIAERERDVELAVKGFTRVLDEKTWTASEEVERAKLPERIRVLYRSWIEAAEKQGKAIAGDVAKRVEEVRRKIPPEAIPLLLEAYAARNGTPQSRAAAAAALASSYARLRQPYEAMEWLERASSDRIDPGTEVEAIVAGVIRGYPGLPERAAAVGEVLAPLRKAALRKPGFLGLLVAEVAGKGLRVEGIARSSPAESAELKLGDVITDVGGAAVRSPADLNAALQAAVEGQEIDLKYERGGEPRFVRTKLAPKPAKEPEYVQAPAIAGAVTNIHPTYGVFVKLEPNSLVAKGDTLELVRNGEPVGEMLVDRITVPDARYPDGSAVGKLVSGAAQAGDAARRARK